MPNPNNRLDIVETVNANGGIYQRHTSGNATKGRIKMRTILAIVLLLPSIAIAGERSHFRIGVNVGSGYHSGGFHYSQSRYNGYSNRHFGVNYGHGHYSHYNRCYKPYHRPHHRPYRYRYRSSAYGPHAGVQYGYPYTPNYTPVYPQYSQPYQPQHYQPQPQQPQPQTHYHYHYQQPQPQQSPKYHYQYK